MSVHRTLFSLISHLKVSPSQAFIYWLFSYNFHSMFMRVCVRFKVRCDSVKFSPSSRLAFFVSPSGLMFRVLVASCSILFATYSTFPDVDDADIKLRPSSLCSQCTGGSSPL